MGQVVTPQGVAARRRRDLAGLRVARALNGWRVMRAPLILLAASALLASASPAARAERYAYVLNDGDNTLSAIDVDTATVVASIPVPSGPRAVAVHPDGRTVYVIGTTSSELSVIDVPAHTERLRFSLPAIFDPSDLAIDPAGDFLYIADAFSRNVAQLPTLTLDTAALRYIDIGQTGARRITVDPAGDRVYVVTGSDGRLLWFDVDASGAPSAVSEHATRFSQPRDLSVSFSHTPLVTWQSAPTTYTLSSVNTSTTTGLALPITSTGEPTGIAVYDSFGFPQIFVTRKANDQLVNPFSGETHATQDQPVAATYSDDEDDTADGEALITANFGAGSATLVYGDGRVVHVPTAAEPIDVAAGAVLRPRFLWSPVRLDFEYELFKVALVKRVKVWNGGTGRLRLGAAIIEGRDAGRFVVTKNTCTASLLPGASCFVDVAFTPLPSKDVKWPSFAATLQLSSNDRATPQARIPLTGAARADRLLRARGAVGRRRLLRRPLARFDELGERLRRRGPGLRDVELARGDLGAPRGHQRGADGRRGVARGLLGARRRGGEDDEACGGGEAHGLTVAPVCGHRANRR